MQYCAPLSNNYLMHKDLDLDLNNNVYKTAVIYPAGFTIITEEFIGETGHPRSGLKIETNTAKGYITPLGI